MSQIEYENLKKKLNEMIPCSCLEKVKNCFEYHIGSKRSLYRAKNLSDILDLLEERYLLTCYNVTPLLHLGAVLEKQDITEIVHLYKKIYCSSECITCFSCGEDSSFKPFVKNEKEYNSNDDLTVACHNIAKNIGVYWRVLARELNIPEVYIDEIEVKYPSDSYLQALKALLTWKEYYKETASLDTLKERLESRLCKQKGIGIHLLKPAINI